MCVLHSCVLSDGSIGLSDDAIKISHHNKYEDIIVHTAFGHFDIVVV